MDSNVPYAITVQDQTGYVGIGFASTPSVPTEHNGVLTVAGHTTDNLLYMRSGAGTFFVDATGNLFLYENSGVGGSIVADGSIHASGQLDTGSGVKFPDGTVQTTAYRPAAAATATQSATTQQLVELVRQLQARVKRLEAARK